MVAATAPWTTRTSQRIGVDTPSREKSAHRYNPAPRIDHATRKAAVALAPTRAMATVTATMMTAMTDTYCRLANRRKKRTTGRAETVEGRPSPRTAQSPHDEANTSETSSESWIPHVASPSSRDFPPRNNAGRSRRPNANPMREITAITAIVRGDPTTSPSANPADYAPPICITASLSTTGCRPRGRNLCIHSAWDMPRSGISFSAVHVSDNVATTAAPTATGREIHGRAAASEPAKDSSHPNPDHANPRTMPAATIGYAIPEIFSKSSFIRAR